MVLPNGRINTKPYNPKKENGVMKLKRLFRTHLIIVLLGCMVIGLGLPNDSEADLCSMEGYAVRWVHFGGIGLTFLFREKPIDAGMWFVSIGIGPPDTPEEVAVYNTIRSAYQNNTKLAIVTTIAGVCPTPDLSMPGAYPVGTLVALGPAS
jgi:hypothetical protein